MRSAHASEAVRPAGAWQKFRGWRRSRPFWGGLLLILSGLELFLSGNMNLGALQVHVGATGFLSYVIPAMLVLCGGGALITPHLRLFYGIVGALVAVYSLIGLNFGGFMLGLLLGIIGGALAVAWSPITPARPATTGNDDTGTAGTTAYTATPPTASTGHADAPGPVAEQYAEPQPAYGQAQPYAHSPALDETAEIPRQVQDPERWWGSAHPGSPLRDEEPPPFGENGGGRQPRMMAIALVPVTIAAALVAVVHRATPAYAAPCPTPSASTSAVSGRASTRAGAQLIKPGAKPAAQAGAPAVAPQTGQNAAAQSDTAGVAAPNPSASAAAASSQPAKSGNPLTNLWDGLVSGVKKLFGASDSTTPADTAPSAAPSASASPGPSAAPSAGGASPGASVKPSTSATASKRPRAAASTSTAPCQLSIAALDPEQPPVALAPGLITGAKQVMQDFTYEGLADLPTATGTKKVLKFSMTSAVTTPFTLKVPEKAGRTTEITSTELAIRSQQHTVTFYTSKFTGTLSHVTLPVIPIPIGVPDILKPLTTLTFTPDSPPSLLTGITVPEITFENVTLELAFVNSDVLTAQAMHIQPV